MREKLVTYLSHINRSPIRASFHAGRGHARQIAPDDVERYDRVIAGDQAERLSKARRNNFDFLRLLGAFLVIYGHELGETARNQTVWGSPVHLAGLYIFFCVSGYLVTDSWIRTPDLFAFARKRFFRLFPGLFVLCAVTTVAFGLFVGGQPLPGYFASFDAWAYLSNAVLILHPGIGNVSLVNGSLWSLPVEALCYVVVPIAFAVGRKRVALVTALLSCAAGVLFLTASGRRIEANQVDIGMAGLVVPFFLSAATYRILDRKITYRLDLCIIAIYALSIVASRLYQLATPSLWLLLPFVIIAFGQASTPVLRDVARFGDLSYGVYLYAYPTQLAVEAVFGRENHLLNLVVILPIVLCLAALSWHLVEKPSLRYVLAWSQKKLAFKKLAFSLTWATGRETRRTANQG